MPWDDALRRGVTAPSLDTTVRALDNLLDIVYQHLDLHSDRYADARLKRRPWTRREAFGHLIDYCVAHQRWVTRAITDSKLAAPAYPAEDAAAVRHYSEHPWVDTVKLWVSANRLLLHTLSRIPEGKTQVRCRIGIAPPVPLADLVQAYAAHCDDIAGQVLSMLFR